jgi:hypothetical protein
VPPYSNGNCAFGRKIKKNMVQGFYSRNIKKKDGYIIAVIGLGEKGAFPT